MKTQNSQEPPPVSAWMEDALAWMELAAEVTAGLAAPAESAQPPLAPVSLLDADVDICGLCGEPPTLG